MIAVVKRVLPAALAALLVAATAAYADETITARTPNEFASDVTTIDQGEKVTFRNLDIVGHDVTASGRTDDGQPLFRSELVGPQESGPVRGTEYLVTGTYPFVCTIHPGMEAKLKVTSQGKPLQRPDPPKLTVKVKSGDLQRVVRKRKLAVGVTSTKGAVKLSARAKAGGRSFALGKTSVQFAEAGRRTAVVKLSKSARKALAGHARAKVTVKATVRDAAGQTAKDTASRTLR
jgi:plastocyanin